MFVFIPRFMIIEVNYSPGIKQSPGYTNMASLKSSINLYLVLSSIFTNYNSTLSLFMNKATFNNLLYNFCILSTNYFIGTKFFIQLYLITNINNVQSSGLGMTFLHIHILYFHFIQLFSHTSLPPSLFSPNCSPFHVPSVCILHLN